MSVSSMLKLFVLAGVGSATATELSQPFPPPAVMGDESIMSQKAHGTSATPVQQNLRWNVDRDLADRIANYNRDYAEHAGYWETDSTFKTAEPQGPVTFYDSNTGRPLFTVPGAGRTYQDFLDESHRHGWPSFRDNEVDWDNVRVLPDGETVSTAGTHLGHNLPDGTGSRYCIDLVSVAGRAVQQEEVLAAEVAAERPEGKVDTVERVSVSTSSVTTTVATTTQGESSKSAVTNKIGDSAAAVVGAVLLASFVGVIVSIKLVKRFRAFKYGDVPMENDPPHMHVIS